MQSGRVVRAWCDFFRLKMSDLARIATMLSTAKPSSSPLATVSSSQLVTLGVARVKVGGLEGATSERHQQLHALLAVRVGRDKATVSEPIVHPRYLATLAVGVVLGPVQRAVA